MSWVISRMAVPVSVRRRRIRSRICAWIVTSSAVVGSSAISRSGRQASAMAIITRCAWPPEISCGNDLARRSGSAMPTLRNISTACFQASSLLRPWWIWNTSATWAPTWKTGLRQLVGCWKIMDIWLPRILTISSSGSFTRSRPLKSTSPATILPEAPSSRMIEREVTLLPLPDSPTRPITSPSRMREVNAVDGLHDAIFGVEIGIQPLDVEDGVAFAVVRAIVVLCLSGRAGNWKLETGD